MKKKSDAFLFSLFIHALFHFSNWNENLVLSLSEWRSSFPHPFLLFSFSGKFFIALDLAIFDESNLLTLQVHLHLSLFIKGYIWAFATCLSKNNLPGKLFLTTSLKWVSINHQLLTLMKKWILTFQWHRWRKKQNRISIRSRRRRGWWWWWWWKYASTVDAIDLTHLFTLHE